MDVIRRICMLITSGSLKVKHGDLNILNLSTDFYFFLRGHGNKSCNLLGS